MPFDNNAGKKVGLEIWRIEKKEPARVDPKTFGQFYSGDTYILLKTYKNKEALAWNIHFWLGKESTQDEQGFAALHTIGLDDSLGGGPVQFREVQEYESDQFLALFPNGIKYLQGGIASDFKHVDRSKVETRLFHLKGKRNVRIAAVKPTTDSLNDGDVFILDIGADLFQWNGKHANKFEKAKGLETVTRIRDEERPKAAIHFLEQDTNDGDQKFWTALGGKKAVKAIGKDDDDVKAHEVRLFKVSDASGHIEKTQVGADRLDRSLLDTNDTFILDAGDTIFVWVGKGATKEERNKSMSFAEDFIKNEGRPTHTKIIRVPDGGETPAFKSFFSVWDPPRILDAKEAKAAPPADDTSVSDLVKAKKQAEEKLVDLNGKVRGWRINKLNKEEVPANELGQLYQGDSYLIQYTYSNKGKEQHIVYMWQGKDSTNDEKGASAYMAVQLSDSLKEPSSQVRVVQGKEPQNFIGMFKGKMVVRLGGYASGFKNRAEAAENLDGSALFHIQGTKPTNTLAVQVVPSASSLNSGDSFIVISGTEKFVWFGDGANDSERACALTVAKILQSNIAATEVPEGSEPASFWEALGGQADYPHTKTLSEGSHDPRLFHCSTAAYGGGFKVREVFDFSQDDLINDDVMILDTFDEVFVWIGHDSNDKEKQMAMKVALDYVAASKDRSPDTPVYRVNSGAEPPNFTCSFRGWSDAKASDFSDPYEKKKAGVKGAAPAASPAKPAAAAAPERVTAATVQAASSAAVPVGSKTFTYDELKGNKAVGIDITKKEQYLSDAEFQKVFGMSKADFGKLQGWKQVDAKKKQGLF